MSKSKARPRVSRNSERPLASPDATLNCPMHGPLLTHLGERLPGEIDGFFEWFGHSSRRVERPGSDVAISPARERVLVPVVKVKLLTILLNARRRNAENSGERSHRAGYGQAGEQRRSGAGPSVRPPIR